MDGISLYNLFNTPAIEAVPEHAAGGEDALTDTEQRPEGGHKQPDGTMPSGEGTVSLDQCQTQSINTTASGVTAGGADMRSGVAHQPKAQPATTETGQQLRPVNPKEGGKKPKATGSPTSSGRLGRIRSSVSGSRGATDAETKAPAATPTDGAKTGDEGTNGLDQSMGTTTSSLTTAGGSSRTTSDVSVGPLGPVDDATQGLAGPTPRTAAAAGHIRSASSPKAQRASTTKRGAAKATTGTRGTRTGDRPWHRIFSNLLRGSPEVIDLVNTISAAPASGPEPPLKTPAAPSSSPPSSSSGPDPTPTPTAGFELPAEAPAAASSFSSDPAPDASKEPAAPEEGGTDKADPSAPPSTDVPTELPLLQRLRECLTRKRQSRLRQDARCNALAHIEAPTATISPTLTPAEVQEAMAKVVGMTTELEGRLVELQELKERQDALNRAETLRLECSREKEQVARERAEKEADKCGRKLAEAEGQLCYLRGQKQGAEKAYRASLNALWERLREEGAERKEALDSAQKELERLWQEVKTLRGKEAHQTHIIKTLRLTSQQVEMIISDCEQRVEIAKAKARDEQQRASAEERRAQIAEAEAGEQRQRAEAVEADKAALLQGLEQRDACVTQLEEGRQSDQARMRELEAHTEKLEAKVASLMDLVQLKDAQLAQAKAESLQAHRTRLIQASQVLLHPDSHKALLLDLETRGIEVKAAGRCNKDFDRLIGVKAGAPPVPVTIRLYLSSAMAAAAASELEAGKEHLGLLEVLSCTVGQQHAGVHVVVLVGMNSNHDVEYGDIDPKVESEEGEGSAMNYADHSNQAFAEMWAVTEGEEGYDGTAPLTEALASSEIEEKLGAGAFGTVLKVTDKRTGEAYCIKVQVLHAARRCVVMERRLGAMLQNSHYSMGFDIAWIGDKYSVARMPFLVGSVTLYNAQVEGYFNEGPHLAVRLESVTKQLLGAVGELQTYGVAHRDIKSPNVLIIRPNGADGNELYIKVIDFGMATDRCDEVPVVSGGTAGYMPVESLMSCLFPGLTQGVFSDLFAVAETVFRLLPLPVLQSVLGTNPQLLDLLNDFPNTCHKYLNSPSRLAREDIVNMQHGFTAYPEVVAATLELLVMGRPEVMSESTGKAIAIGLRYDREQRLPMINVPWEDMADQAWMPTAPIAAPATAEPTE